MSADLSDLMFFNGINARTGDYLVPPLTADQLSNLARGKPPFTPEQKNDLGAELEWRANKDQAHFGTAEGVDPKDLAQTGWGVIFAAAADPKIKDALTEL